MQEAVRLALESAQAAGAQHIHRLALRVGALSGAVPDALRFAFPLVCAGTIAQGATLDIESVPAAGWCGYCQAEYRCEDYLSECPRCRQISAELRRGTELELAAVEVS